MTETITAPLSKLRSYVQLLRLPNVFTAAADVMMGYLFTHDPEQESLAPLAALVAASACLYMAGMVLNDVFDIEVDREERPERPLPSGRISLAAARALGFGLLLAGVAIAAGVSVVLHEPRCGIVGLGLAAMVLVYDGWLKKTPLGPLGMGACRMLNVLLGMSLAGAAWNGLNYWVAGGIGLYVIGLTWFARQEAEPESHRVQLSGAMLVMLAGIALLWWLPHADYFPQDFEPRKLSAQLAGGPDRWNLCWALLAAIVGWRSIRAIVQPYSEFVQEAIKQGITSLIFFDAITVFALRDPTWALAVVVLVVPMTLLGRWSYST